MGNRMAQTSKVLEHIKRCGSITSMEAFRQYGITRLSGRIFDLRRAGYPISMTYENNGDARYGVYRLEEVTA